MKKGLQLITLLLMLPLFVNGQYYYNPFLNDGQNPKGLNTDGENPYPSTANTGWAVIWNGGATSTTSYAPEQNIPFAFEFNGIPVTKYTAGNFGVVTFDAGTPTEKPSTFSNFTLPHTDIPDNSVCVLGIKPINLTSGQTTYTSAIMTKTYGTAPNRQHWIWFNFFGEANISQGWTYWGVVLEESTNNIYIVDMKTLCVTGGNLCSNNVKISAGIQIDSTTAISINGSPNLGAQQITQNIFTAEDNSYYQFVQGTQPTEDVYVRSITNSEYIAIVDGAVTLKAKIRNLGSAPLTSLTATYTVNGGTSQTSTISIPSLSYNNEAEISHPITWSPSTVGAYNVEFSVTNPNGNIDPNPLDNSASKTFQVEQEYAVRKALIETFSSSTCPPCRQGNINLNNVLQTVPGQYVSLKYQVNWPSTGDPYYTAETGSRRTYYGVNAAPNTSIDGGAVYNTGSTTKAMIDNANAIPALIEITGTSWLSWKNKVNYDIDIKPKANLPSGLVMHIAIAEKITYNNVKTNGETEFHHVMKKMVPNNLGTTLPAMTTGNTLKRTGFYEFKGEYRLPNDALSPINHVIEHSVENFANLELIVFIQNATTRNVYQAYRTDIAFNASIPESELQKSLSIFPNPATNSLFVSYDKAATANTIIRDINGKVVYQHNTDFDYGASTNEVDLSAFASGVYTLTVISNENLPVTKKFVVAK
jgi:hypothetical protein